MIEVVATGPELFARFGVDAVGLPVLVHVDEGRSSRWWGSVSLKVAQLQGCDLMSPALKMYVSGDKRLGRIALILSQAWMQCLEKV